MIRIYILGRYFDMSPSALARALSQIEFFRNFALIDLDYGVLPSLSCIEGFNLILKEKKLKLKLEQAIIIKPIEAECSIAF